MSTNTLPLRNAREGRVSKDPVGSGRVFFFFERARCFFTRWSIANHDSWMDFLIGSMEPLAQRQNGAGSVGMRYRTVAHTPFVLSQICSE